MLKSDEIHKRLTEVFSPKQLSVVDESEAHRGHAGYREGGQSHFRVEISDPVFAPMTRLARHRAVHEALGQDLLNSIHALALKIEG